MDEIVENVDSKSRNDVMQSEDRCDPSQSNALSYSFITRIEILFTFPNHKECALFLFSSIIFGYQS